MAFATPTELKPQFILPLSYESGRFRLQAQLKEARRHIVSWPNTQIWEFGQALLPVRTGGGSEMQCAAGAHTVWGWVRSTGSRRVGASAPESYPNRHGHRSARSPPLGALARHPSVDLGRHQSASQTVPPTRVQQ